jgi:hypothetical protein
MYIIRELTFKVNGTRFILIFERRFFKAIAYWMQPCHYVQTGDTVAGIILVYKRRCTTGDSLRANHDAATVLEKARTNCGELIEHNFDASRKAHNNYI